MSDVNKLDQNTLNVMLSALQEVHNSVRAYDTKAQVVSIAFIFSLGLIYKANRDIISSPSEVNEIL